MTWLVLSPPSLIFRILLSEKVRGPDPHIVFFFSSVMITHVPSHNLRHAPGPSFSGFVVFEKYLISND